MHSAILRLLAIFVAIPVSHALAQEAKPADPFIKEKPGAGAKAGGAAPVVNRPGPPPVVPLVPEPVQANLLVTFETYTLSQDALDAIHEEATVAPQIYDRVRQLVGDGKASLEGVIALPTRSGQRATTESIDEPIYPTEFSAPVPGRDFGFPTAFEMRPTGQRIEMDPILGPDQTQLDLNLAPDFARLTGFVLHKSEPNAGGELQPLFATRKVTTSVSSRIGVPVLISTVSRPKNTGIAGADGDGSVSLIFAIGRLAGPTEVMPPLNAGIANELGNVRLVFRFYSMPRTTGRDLLASTVDSDKLYALVRALPTNDLRLERLFTLHTRSGQRASLEETAEYTYGTEVDPPVPPRLSNQQAKPPAPAKEGEAAAPAPADNTPVFTSTKLVAGRFTSFEMRRLGWMVEVDPVVADDNKQVDLNLVVEHAENRGNLEGHPLLSRYPPQPVFASQKITTSVTSIPGHQCFLGTFNAPRDTGVNDRKDDGRVWFAFVKVSLE